LGNNNCEGWSVGYLKELDAYKLMSDPRFRDSECPVSRYHDPVAILRISELIELLELEGRFSAYQDKNERAIEFYQHLDEACKRKEQWVVVIVSEYG
jgi:hypothetical protein